MNHRLAVAACAGAAALALPAVASAEETTCRGTLRAVTVDNLRVPDGASCVLRGTRIEGTVKVESGASLRAFRVDVIGNVHGENARRVAVRRGSQIGGSVQVDQGVNARVSGSRITHDIQFDQNTGRLRAARNEVGGSIQVFGNHALATITGNRVDGNLQCKENEPRPVGGGNVVQGTKEDQCEAL